MKVKTAILNDKALDFAVNVVLCLKQKPKIERETDFHHPFFPHFSDGEQFAALLNEYKISVLPRFDNGVFTHWHAHSHDLQYGDDGEYIEGSDHAQQGPTAVIAALRCLVSTYLGAEVDIPDELLDDAQNPSSCAIAEMVAQNQTTFDPGQQFETVAQAMSLILSQPDPVSALANVVSYNIQSGEYSFAAECIQEFGGQ